MATLPNFLVVGAPRSGTTSLHYYLDEHPQICMSAIKEPNFFLFGADGEPFIAEANIVTKSVRSLDDYSQLFRVTAEHRAIGEVSPLYLSVPETPGRIRDTCGPIKVVCLLRSPAERAWSHFLHAFPEHGDAAPAAFAEMVRAEMAAGPSTEPYRTRTHLLTIGLYAEQVQRYRDTFGDDAVLVLLTEDLEQDTDATLAEVAAFVGVDATHRFESEKRYNISGQRPTGFVGMARGAVRKVQPRLKAVLPPSVAGRLGRVRVAMDDRSIKAAPTLDPAIRAEIDAWCRADVERLAAMIDRDLSSWLGADAGTDPGAGSAQPASDR